MTCSYTDTGVRHSPSLPKLPSNLTIPQKLTSSMDTAAKDAEWEKLGALFTAQPLPRSLVYLLRVQGVIPILANRHANQKSKIKRENAKEVMSVRLTEFLNRPRVTLNRPQGMRSLS